MYRAHLEVPPGTVSGNVAYDGYSGYYYSNGSGAAGGGGAGGTIEVIGSEVIATPDAFVTASRGYGGTGDVNPAMNGRYIQLSNTSQSTAPALYATTPVDTTGDAGPTDANPFIYPTDSVSTPMIPNLAGGAAALGLTSNVPSIFTAPGNTVTNEEASYPGAVAAIYRTHLATVGDAAGDSYDFTGYDAVYLINLSPTLSLTNLELGAGSSGYLTDLQQGFAVDPLTDSDGRQFLSQLEPGQVFMTLVPSSETTFSATVTYDGTPVSISNAPLANDGSGATQPSVAYLVLPHTILSPQPSLPSPIYAGQTFTLSAASSYSALGLDSVQWKVETSGSLSFVSISDGLVYPGAPADSLYSGTQTGSLTISGATAAMSGDQFDAVFTNAAGSISTQAVTLTVDAQLGNVINDVAGAPNVDEGAAASTTVGGLTASIANPSVVNPSGQPLTYSLTNSAGGLFTIDSSSGVVSAAPFAPGAQLDAQTEGPTQEIAIEATNVYGGISNVNQFFIAINPVPPVNPWATVSNGEVLEGSAADTAVGIQVTSMSPGGEPIVSYSISSVLDSQGNPVSGQLFYVDSSGAVLTSGALISYANSPGYTIYVQATNSPTNSYGSVSGAFPFTIDVTPVPPSAPTNGNPPLPPDGSVQEFADAKTSVGITLYSKAPGGEPVTYSLKDDAGGRFTIDKSSHAIIVADGTLLDYSKATSYTVTVQAQDQYNEGSPPATATFTIAVTKAPPSPLVNLANQNQSPPVAPSVLVGATTGTLVGITAYAIDPEANDPITYSLLGDPKRRFAITTANGVGVVTVNNGSLISYSDGSYPITVQASDQEGQTSSAQFTITVTSNEPGSKMVGPFQITNPATSDTVGSTITGTANLPLIGNGVPLTGTVIAPGQYSFSAPFSSLYVDGFLLTNGSYTLNSSGLELAGLLNLPVLGANNQPVIAPVQVPGFVVDSTDYSRSLSSPLASIGFGSFTLSNPSITLSRAGQTSASVAFSGQTSLPLFGTITFAGTIAAGGSYSITAQPASTKLFSNLVQLSNEMLTLTPSAVTLTAQATIGNVAFQGSYDDATHQWALSGTPVDAGGAPIVDDLNIGPLTLGVSGLTLSSSGLSVSGTASVPTIPSLGSSAITATVDYLGDISGGFTQNGSLAYSLGGFPLTQGTVDFQYDGSTQQATFAARGVVSLLPGVSVTLSGDVSSDGTYDLRTQANTNLTLDGLGLSNVACDLTNQGFTFSGEWANSVFTSALQQATIHSDGTIDFQTVPVSGNLGGIALQNIQANVELDSASGDSSISLSADADNLPLVDSLHLTGSYLNGDYSITVWLPSTFSLDGFGLQNATATIDESGLSLAGTADLPLVNTGNGVALSGQIQDADHYSITAQLPNFMLAGFTLVSPTVSLSNDGIGLSGTVDSSLLGDNLSLVGSITSANAFSLSYHLPNDVNLDGFVLTGDMVTLDQTGLTISGNKSLPLLGNVTLGGHVDTDGSLSISGTLGTRSLLGGLVQLNQTTLTLAPDKISIDAQASVRDIPASVEFKGSFDTLGNYSITTSANIDIAGFSIPAGNRAATRTPAARQFRQARLS